MSKLTEELAFLLEQRQVGIISDDCDLWSLMDMAVRDHLDFYPEERDKHDRAREFAQFVTRQPCSV